MSTNGRQPGFPILPLLVERYSPRGFSGEPVREEEMMPLLEAARWAPSSYNDQPWRYVYVLQGDAEWQSFFDLMVPANQEWAKTAGALVIVISSKNFAKTGEFSPTHSYDTGAASQNLALQGHAMGLGVHSLGGFDYVRAAALLKLPDSYAVEAMMAIGRLSATPPIKFSQRKPLEQIAFRGKIVI